MRLSIIIPIKHIEPKLSKLIDSLRPYEVILVGPKQIVKEKVKWISADTKSRAEAMNLGAKAAKGSKLLFLHADTSITRKAVYYIANLDDNIVGGGCYMSFKPTNFLLKVISFFSNIRMSKFKIIYGDQCIFVQRSVFEKMNGFKELMICEDVDFSLRLKKQGPLKFYKSCKSSSRRFMQNGIIKQMFFNWYIVFLFYLGVNDKKLRRMYS